MENKIKLLCENLSEDAEKLTEIREYISEAWCSDSAEIFSDDMKSIHKSLVNIISELEDMEKTR